MAGSLTFAGSFVSDYASPTGVPWAAVSVWDPTVFLLSPVDCSTLLPATQLFLGYWFPALSAWVWMDFPWLIGVLSAMLTSWWTFLSDPQFLLLTTLVQFGTFCHDLGWTRFLQRPTIRWKMRGGYPAVWMLLSSVMLSSSFVNGGLLERQAGQFGPDGGVTGSLVLTGLQAYDYMCPPREPWDLNGQWGSQWDPDELCGDVFHQFVHKAGFAEEYVEDLAPELGKVQAVADFSLRTTTKNTDLNQIRPPMYGGATSFVSANDGTLPEKRHVFDVPLHPKCLAANCGCALREKGDIVFDTGASGTFSPFKSDFVVLEHLKGLVHLFIM